MFVCIISVSVMTATRRNNSPEADKRFPSSIYYDVTGMIYGPLSSDECFFLAARPNASACRRLIKLHFNARSTRVIVFLCTSLRFSRIIVT